MMESGEDLDEIEDPEAAEAEAELEELFPTSEEEALDPGRLAHDQDVVLTAVNSAETSLPSLRSTLTQDLSAERKMASGILTKVRNC